MKIARKIVLIKQFKGFPKNEDVTIVEEELPALKDNEFLAKTLYLSIDPFQRVTPLHIGDTIVGFQLAEIVESKHPEFKIGAHIITYFGMRDYTISNGKGSWNGFPVAYHVPLIRDVPLSAFLSGLGMPGCCAYFGLLKICKPKSGETVVISGAAGAIGHIAGQIAKIKGCRVIGITGSDEKGNWLVNKLNFDTYVNYKSNDFARRLQKAAPNKIDCYFDNVGGEVSSIVISHMKKYGRISACGAISSYNSNKAEKVSPIITTELMLKELKLEGFLIGSWFAQFPEAIEEMSAWYKEGKLKINDQITKGFENSFTALINMLQGGNIGKTLVKC